MSFTRPFLVFARLGPAQTPLPVSLVGFVTQPGSKPGTASGETIGGSQQYISYCPENKGPYPRRRKTEASAQD